jgi:hypothetical protein
MKKLLGAFAVVALMIPTGMIPTGVANAQTSVYQSVEPNFGATNTARPPFQTLEAYRVGPTTRPVQQQMTPVVVARPAPQSRSNYYPGSCAPGGNFATQSNVAATNGLIPGGGKADIAPSLRPTVSQQNPRLQYQGSSYQQPQRYQPQVYQRQAFQQPSCQTQLYRAPPAGYYQQQQRTYSAPRGAQLSKGIYGQPTVYVPGQPVRNFWRYWTP